MLQIPFELREDLTGKTYDMILNSGFLGFEQDTVNYTLSPILGWFITEKKMTLMKEMMNFGENSIMKDLKIYRKNLNGKYYIKQINFYID